MSRRSIGRSRAIMGINIQLPYEWSRLINYDTIHYCLDTAASSLTICGMSLTHSVRPTKPTTRSACAWAFLLGSCQFIVSLTHRLALINLNKYMDELRFTFRILKTHHQNNYNRSIEWSHDRYNGLTLHQLHETGLAWRFVFSCCKFNLCLNLLITLNRI